MRLCHAVILRAHAGWLRTVTLGSPRWHKHQERLGRKPHVGVGQSMRNQFYRQTLLECGNGLFVHPNVSFHHPRNISLGRNVFINRGVWVMAPVPIRIGNNVLIGPYVVLNSGSHLFESRDLPIADQGHRYGEIVIEEDVWIGAHACILPGACIGRGSVVGAGAVVTKPVPPFTVVAGVPARPIGVRGTPGGGRAEAPASFRCRPARW